MSVCNATWIVVLIEQPGRLVVDGDDAMVLAFSQAVQVRLPRGLLSHTLRSYWVRLGVFVYTCKVGDEVGDH